MRIYEGSISGEFNFITFPRRVAKIRGGSAKYGNRYKIDVEESEEESGRRAIYFSYPENVVPVVETDNLVVLMVPGEDYIVMTRKAEGELENPEEGEIQMLLPGRVRIDAQRIAYLKGQSQRRMRIKDDLRTPNPDQCGEPLGLLEKTVQ
jgi:hypothetical protein